MIKEVNSGSGFNVTRPGEKPQCDHVHVNYIESNNASSDEGGLCWIQRSPIRLKGWALTLAYDSDIRLEIKLLHADSMEFGIFNYPWMSLRCGST
jgi:hypothetical protein